MVSRYGVKVRKSNDAAKAQTASLYECPKCGKHNVKRRSYAQWECRSCGAKFAGGAYTPETSVGVTARKAITGIKGPAQARGK